MMSERTKSSAKTTGARRMTVALAAAVAMFGAAGMVSLGGCKQEQSKEMTAPANNDIPKGCSPATTPCQ